MNGLKTVAIILIALLVFGCSQQTQQAQPSAAPSAAPSFAPSLTPPSLVPSPTPESKFVPLKLEYALTMDVDGQKMVVNAQYFFEEEKKCGNKQALLGLLRAVDESHPEAVSWVKTTLYLDDELLVPSQQMSETDLAFDNAKPRIGDWDLAFFMNSLFASVGQDFASSGVWTSEEPTILKSARLSSDAPSDVSVVKKGVGSGGAEPCVEFAVVSRTSGEWTACVTQPANETLTYAVYVKSKNPGFGWELKKTSKQKSGVVRTLQCLEPVSCPFVQMPSGDARQACERESNAMQDERDDKGCVTKYVCTPLGIKVKVYSSSGPVVGAEVAVRNLDANNPIPFLQSTDANGETFFKVGPGDYEIGFTTSKFPANYEIPPKTTVHYPGGVATHEVHVNEKQ